MINLLALLKDNENLTVKHKDGSIYKVLGICKVKHEDKVLDWLVGYRSISSGQVYVRHYNDFGNFEAVDIVLATADSGSEASKQLIINAFIEGFYEGAGDDLWYKDHNSIDGGVTTLNEDAEVYKPLSEYLLSIEKDVRI